jgi:hypothetical protein
MLATLLPRSNPQDRVDLQEALIEFAETFDRRMVELLPFIENGKSPIGHVATGARHESGD